MSDRDDFFWKNKRLGDLSPAEWESLCDGCGRCCLHKLEDKDTGKIYHTMLACHLLDPYHCRCLKYDKRTRLVPHCLVLTPANTPALDWLPATCAYRLISFGRDLYAWHPLISQNPQSVHAAGISVRYRTVPETVVEFDHWQDFIIDDEF
jgi:uncharacterized cysteine cluster protein YcgN (CxxCxxCC family)